MSGLSKKEKSKAKVAAVREGLRSESCLAPVQAEPSRVSESIEGLEGSPGSNHDATSSQREEIDDLI